MGKHIGWMQWEAGHGVSTLTEVELGDAHAGGSVGSRQHAREHDLQHIRMQLSAMRKLQ
jgi:hypothetical protein